MLLLPPRFGVTLFYDMAREKYFVLDRLEQQPKDPFHLSSLSPRSPQFQQSAGATPLSSLSGSNALLYSFYIRLEYIPYIFLGALESNGMLKLNQKKPIVYLRKSSGKKVP